MESVSACPDYKPWCDCHPGLKSYECCHLAVDGSVCRFGPGKYAQTPCPWKGRPVDRVYEV